MPFSASYLISQRGSIEPDPKISLFQYHISGGRDHTAETIPLDQHILSPCRCTPSRENWQLRTASLINDRNPVQDSQALLSISCCITVTSLYAHYGCRIAHKRANLCVSSALYCRTCTSQRERTHFRRFFFISSIVMHPTLTLCIVTIAYNSFYQKANRH